MTGLLPHRKRVRATKLLPISAKGDSLIASSRFEEVAMPRLFTALEIPRDASLSLSLLRGGLPGARWIDTEN